MWELGGWAGKNTPPTPSPEASGELWESSSQAQERGVPGDAGHPTLHSPTCRKAEMAGQGQAGGKGLWWRRVSAIGTQGCSSLTVERLLRGWRESRDNFNVHTAFRVRLPPSFPGERLTPPARAVLSEAGRGHPQAAFPGKHRARA